MGFEKSINRILGFECGLVSAEAAVDAMQPYDIVMKFLAERLEFMTRLKNWLNTSRGRPRRIAQNLRFGENNVQ